MKANLPLLTIFCITSLACPWANADYKEGKTTVSPVTAPACEWGGGFYLGFHAGYGWSAAGTAFEPLPDPVTFADLRPTTLDADLGGLIGGVQLGYNFQIGGFVLGPETDFSWTDLDDTKTRNPLIDNFGMPYPGAFITVGQKRDWFGTARLRAGYAPICWLLLYATGGVAYGEASYSANTSFPAVRFTGSASDTKVGWTAGGGAEFALNRHWSVKLEYLYYDLGDKSFTSAISPPFFSVRYVADTAAHTANVGLNFRF